MDGNGEDRVLAVEQRGAVLYLTLDRPEVLNALNARVFSELEAQISAVAADPGIRAVVIAGAGDRAFSAGAADLGLLCQTPVPDRELLEAAGDLAESIAGKSPRAAGLILKSMGSNAGLDTGLAHETTLAALAAASGDA